LPGESLEQSNCVSLSCMSAGYCEDVKCACAWKALRMSVEL
jgi:hypothetical protein